MSRQWLIVAILGIGLVAGASALVRIGKGIDQVKPGAQAPDFTVIELATGDTISLRDRYAGQVTLLNIWATWCVPCRTEMPDMQAVYQDLASRGLKIAAVSIDEGSGDPVVEFANELGLDFDILHDPSTRIQQIFQTTGVPESFLLDKNGVIQRRIIGREDWNSQVNRDRIERLLEEDAAQPRSPS
jgi:peroxiredoxin